MAPSMTFVSTSSTTNLAACLGTELYIPAYIQCSMIGLNPYAKL